MLQPGYAIIFRNGAYDVIRITSNGDVLVRHTGTLEEIWVDYFDIDFADPYSDPGALLEALARIKSHDDDEAASDKLALQGQEEVVNDAVEPYKEGRGDRQSSRNARFQHRRPRSPALRT